MGPVFDSEIDDIIYETATKNRKIELFPILLLASPPESIVDAVNSLVNKRSYIKIRDKGQTKEERDQPYD